MDSSTAYFWRPLCLALLALGLSGCVHRRVTIYSEPPGATVLVEGDEIGQTPCSFDFTYYGTREFTLIKDGYETRTVLQPVGAPWYQIPPAEFVSDNLALRRITDRRSFTYQLKPLMVPNTQDLLDRASGVRGQADIPQ